MVETRTTEHKGIQGIHCSYSQHGSFIAVILNMGLIRKPTLEQYWRTGSESQKTPWFREMFSRNRFQLILKFLHVVNNKTIPSKGQPGYRPDAKFKPVIDHFNMRSKYLYKPSQKLSIDESLVACKARSVMTQYIPSKSSKFGIKFWMLVESISGFLCRIITYRGKKYDPVPRHQLQGSDDILNLLGQSDLLNQQYHVYCDSFFSSIDIACRLARLGTYFTGTLRKNRPMPLVVKEADLSPDTSVFMRRGDLLAVAYRQSDKKPVRMISTYHSAKVLTGGKPKLVEKYNKYMGGVDLNDMMTGFYTDKRKSVKMWKKIVFNIIQRMIINAYVLYTENTSDNPVKSRLRFTECIIDSLSADYNIDRKLSRRTRVAVELCKVKNPKDCAVCSNRHRGRRMRTRYSCNACGRGVHPLCLKRHVCSEE